MNHYAYIGCRTTKERNARGKGISVYRITSDGLWELIQLVEGLVNPSYLCLDRTGDHLYTVHGDHQEVSAFARDQKTGKLTWLNTVSTGGTNPVHLTMDKSNRWLFVANLQTGTVAVIPRLENGCLGGYQKLYAIPGKEDEAISHPHQVMLDTSGNYLAVSCQGRKHGYGQVDVFRIQSDCGELQKTCEVRSREIAEPRHLVFHTNGIWAYGVNEKDYSVTAYSFDQSCGKLVPRQILPTLPDTYTGDGWASGIILSDNETHVVVSNRKHDSITSFRIRQDGLLEYCDCIKTGGGQPRFITASPWGTILAANETTDTVTEFILNRETGKFSPTGIKLDTESPVCLIFDK